MYCTSLRLQPRKGGLFCIFSNCLVLGLAAAGENYMRFLRTCNFQLPQNRLTCSYCRWIKLFKPSMCVPGTTGARGWEEFIPCVNSLHLIIRTSFLWICSFSLVYEDTCLFYLFNSAVMSPSCSYCYCCQNVNCVQFINANNFSLFFEIWINSSWFLKVNSYSELLDLITGKNFQMALFITLWHTVSHSIIYIAGNDFLSLSGLPVLYKWGAPFVVHRISEKYILHIFSLLPQL